MSIIKRQVIALEVAEQTSVAIYLDTGGDTAVLMLNGGAQIRSGSHRQYTQLAEALAARGISSLRFDFPGFGDCAGASADFQQHARYIPAVCYQLTRKHPELHSLILLGLCDGASAALLANPAAISQCMGLILINPWFRQADQYAATVLNTYYRQRLFSRTFWRKIVRGQWSLQRSVLDFVTLWRQKQTKTAKTSQPHFTQLMLSNWQVFPGLSCVITAGQDLTAQEFLRFCQQNASATTLMQAQQHVHLAAADHTFSSLDQQAWLCEQVVQFAVKIAKNSSK